MKDRVYRKFAVLLAAALCIVSLAACGSKPSSSAASESITSTTSTEAVKEPAEVTADLDWLKGQTIYIELGYKAGGSLDLMLRNITPIWQEIAGCTFVIENRTGANGQVAAQYVLTQPVETTSLLAYTELYQSSMYITQDPGFGVDDFSLINMQVVDPTTITVLKDSEYQSFEDLINAMKANPGTIICAGLANGPGTLWAELIKEAYGVDFKYVIYDDGASMRTAMLGKHADFMFGSTSGDTGLGDDALPLVVVGDERSELWPDTPCTAEVMPELNVPNALGSSRVICVTSEFKEKYPERFLALVETYQQALESDEYQQIITASGEDSITHYYGPEKSDELQQSLYKMCLENKDILTN